MEQIVRNPEEIVDLINDIQSDALSAEGCSCALKYDTEDKQKWIDWLVGETESYE